MKQGYIARLSKLLGLAKSSRANQLKRKRNRQLFVEGLERREVFASLGDITFLGIDTAGPGSAGSATDDWVAFVALNSIPANDTIYLTDNELATATSTSFNTGESYSKWVAPAGGVSAGTVVLLTGFSGSSPTANVGTVSVVTFSGSTNRGFSMTADNVIAYTASSDATANTPTAFLARINIGNAEDGVAPSSLTTTNISFTSGSDSGYYTGSRTSQSTFAGYLSLIGNTANWTTQTGTLAATTSGLTTAFTLAVTTVTSSAATSITSSGATLNGNVTSDGGATLTDRGFVYSLTSDNSNPTIDGTGVTKVQNLGQTGTFSSALTGLTSSSGYSFRAYAINSQGTTYSSALTFTTQGAPVAPTVTSPTSTSITHNSATLGGNVTSDGNSTITERGVVYALTSANSNPTLNGTGTTKVTGTGTTGVFTVSATGLTASSGYSFVAYATNAQGTSYSTVGTFTTLATPVAPTVTSPTSTNVTATSATLGGNVTSDGNSTITARGVVYSLTSANANPQIGGTGVTNVTGTGTTGTFTVSATGLTSSSAYTFAAYATNAQGTTYSSLGTFTTLVAPVVWNFGTTDNATTAVPTAQPSNSTVSNLTRGNDNFATSDALIRTNSVSSGYTGATGSGNATVAAVGGQLNTSTSAYFQFTITPNSGFQTSLNSISFGARSTTSGPLNYSFRSSANNFATSTELATGSLLNDGNWALINPTLTSSTSTVSVPLTYRIYGFGGSATAATSAQAANFRIDDLNLNLNTVAVPTITSGAASPASVSTTYGNASSNTSFAVSGINLTNDIIVGAPSGFQVSTSPTSGFGTSVTLVQAGGSVPSTTVYARLASTTSVGVYSGNVTLTSTGATTVNVAIANSTVSARVLNITADAKTKEYGAADPSLTYTYGSGELVNGDTIPGNLTRVSGEAPGTYQIQIGSINPGANYSINYTPALLTINAPIAPTFTSGTINGDDRFTLSNKQRSELTSLVLNFSVPVTVESGAFTLENWGLLTLATTPTTLGSSQILVTGSGTSQLTLRWGAGTGVVSRLGTDEKGNSLADGIWKLTVDASKIKNQGITPMSANAVFGGTTVNSDNFFRMYGDGDGDGDVDASDTAYFRRALTQYDPAYDFNGNGSVTNGTVDSTNYTANYNKKRR